jgi:hypothetical protein
MPVRSWTGLQAAGHGPAMASADALTEAFLRSQWRVVAKTATVSLHGNTYQVEPALAGCKVELVFSPFNLEVITVRYQDADYGRAVPHRITRHTHPKARPETPEPAPAPATGIAYLQLVADAHHQQIAADERIGFHALYPTRQTPPPDNKAPQDGQLAGQLSIDEAVNEAVNEAVTKHDVTEQDTQARA